MSVKSVKLESSAKRACLLVALLFCLAGVFFFAKWCFGNTIAVQATYTPERAAPKDVAELAIYLAPNDPQSHYALAVLNEKSFLAEDLPKSLAEYEKATALAPHDFRLWLALGTARERTGDAAGAEKALRKALELAPNYAEVQWTLGNILLRQDKTDEAFAEIRKAVASDAKYVGPAVSTAWQAFGDIARVKQTLGDSVQINSALAVFLAREKRFEEALQIWNALPENEKKTTFKQNGEDIFKEMIAAKKYRSALEVQRQFSETANQAVGKFTNAGFEEKIITASPNIFDWQIPEGLHPQIGPNNAQKRGGNLSLVFIFNSSDGKEFRTVSQTIAVEPGKKYNLEAFYKSELKASATLRWEIADVSDGKLLATTAAVSANADWTSLNAEFTAPENTEAVIVRLVRDGCKTSICPISGSIWFDDFSIK
jgi:thioredoxin-like negative regulator of GroEL